MDKGKPKLDRNISITDFKNYYWTKEELVGLCRNIGINYSGGKNKVLPIFR